MPFAVVGSDKEYQVNGKRVLGRKTPWGIVEGASCGLLAFFLQMLTPRCSIAYDGFKWILFNFILQWKIPIIVNLPCWGISWSGKQVWSGYFSIRACLVTFVASITQASTMCLFLRSHLQDLKEVTHNIHYETYRAKRLNENGGLHPISCNDTQESNL